MLISIDVSPLTGAATGLPIATEALSADDNSVCDGLRISCCLFERAGDTVEVAETAAICEAAGVVSTADGSPATRRSSKISPVPIYVNRTKQLKCRPYTP